MTVAIRVESEGGRNSPQGDQVASEKREMERNKNRRQDGSSAKREGKVHGRLLLRCAIGKIKRHGGESDKRK